MKGRKFGIRLMAALLAFLMLLGLLPMVAGAEESEPTGNPSTVEISDNTSNPGSGSTGGLENLHLNKTAVLQDDGTWTITLEAFATGTVKYDVVTQVVPTDIVLVLDQSGSMTQNNLTVAGQMTEYTESVTNAQLASGEYYFYDVNDDAYYPVQVSRDLMVYNTYWEWKDSANQTKRLLQSENTTTNTIVTELAISANGQQHTIVSEEGRGYVVADYLLYQRSSSGSGLNRKYNYNLIANGTGVDVSDKMRTPVSDAQGQNNAWNQLANWVRSNRSWQTVESFTVGGSTYAMVFTEATLVDDSTYQYTYSYVDDQQQTWVVGHSANDQQDGDYYDHAIRPLFAKTADTQVTRLAALQSAAKSFISNMNKAAQTHAVDHKIAIVGYSGNDKDSSGPMSTTSDNYKNYYYVNSELFIGATQYNYASGGKGSTYNSDGSLADDKYGAALQLVGDAAGYQNLDNSINALAGNGPTRPQVGMEMAYGILSKNAAEYNAGTRKAVVIFMTDGFPGWSSTQETNIDDSDASDTVSWATKIKSKTTTDAQGETTVGCNATIYTLAVLDKALTNGSEADTFLKNVSSDSDYTLASSGVDLTTFFDRIKVDTSSTLNTVSLTTNAFLVDRVSEHFNMPELTKQQENETVEDYKKRVSDYLDAYVTVYTAEHLGNLEFDTPHPVDYAHDTSVSDPENDNLVHVWPSFSDADGLAHGITTHNFNFTSIDKVENGVTVEGNMVQTHYAEEFEDNNRNGKWDEGENYVDANGNGKFDDYGDDGMEGTGKKLIIQIKGLTAKDSAAKDGYVNTNNEYSGLWDKTESGEYGMLKAFPMPVANVVPVVYVLDYAKEALLDTQSNIRSAYGLDKSDDKVLNGFASAGTNIDYTTSMQLNYGFIQIKTIEKEGTQFGKVYYTPTTTQWGGYDSFYVFWENAVGTHTGGELGVGDPVSGNGWSKVSVIPANNVYYEDTFTTGEHTDNQGTPDAADDVTYNINAGIAYTNGTRPEGISDEEWNNFKTVWESVSDNKNTSSDNSNTEIPEQTGKDENHGWVEDLANDTGFSDGTAHMVQAVTGQKNAQLPSAKFTFTGTGVDLYSYTNNQSGAILVKVQDKGNYSTPKVTESVTTEYITPENSDDVSGNYVKTTTVTTTTTRTKVPTKFFLVDNLAVSNVAAGYYQIPTVSFAPKHTVTKSTVTNVVITKPDGEVVSNDTSEPVNTVTEEPAHSTYEVTIYVNTVTDEAGQRFEYYLDGIRVYNPLSIEQENDPVVDKAYGDKELKSVFTEVRDIVLLNEDFNVKPTVAEYTVTFDTNGGDALADNLQCTVNGKLQSLPTAAREGFVFTGWYDEAEGGNKVTTETTFTASATVYAQWITAESVTGQYTVTFNYNYDGAPEETLTAQTLEGKLVYMPVVEREGYTLAGWYLSQAAEGDAVTTATQFNDAVTVYASWTQNPADSDGESVNNSADAQKEGAVFIDWIKDEQSPNEGEEGIHTYTIAVKDVFEKYGPKNEIYLEKNQSIVIKLNTANTYHVGLKSLKGDELTVEVSAGAQKKEFNITHTTDLYYEIIPDADGYVSIKNVSKGDALLAITKLKTTNPAAQDLDGGVESITSAQAVNFALRFARMAPVQETPETPVEPETPETPVVPETPDTPVEPETPDVEIVIPDPEPEPDEETTDPKPETPSGAEQLIAQLIAMIDKLFNSMRSWLHT